MKKFLLSLISMLMVLSGTAFADNYQKVTATEDITDGEYLIVYEAGNVAFNGALETLDAVGNTVAVTITDGTIASSETIDAATFTIKVSEGSLKSASGKYIGQSSYANGLSTSDDIIKHSFSIDDSGNAVVSVAVNETQSVTLRYNKSSNQTRFRYYKSGQDAIQLYKKVASQEDTRTATTIELSEGYATNGEVGATIALPTATVKAGDAAVEGAAIEWISTNTGVATIEGSNINLLAAGTTTIKATYAGNETYKGSTASYILSVTAAPYTSLQALQEAVTSTSTPVAIKFTDVFVTAVKGSNAYLADADGYGVLVYTSNHGLEAGQVLNGTINAKLVLYQGKTEITNFTKEGLTITTTELTPTVKTIDAITAANQSTLVTLKNVTFADGKLSDGVNEITYYDNFSAGTPEADKAYDITGIVILHNTTLEIAPRSAADIKEYVPVYIQNADFSSAEGWTAVVSSEYRDLGMYQIGGEQMVRFAAPTADDTHLTTEYAAGFECRWNTNFASYTQTTAEIPAGSYSLVYDVENVNDATTKAEYENRFTVTVGETVYTDDFTEWMNGKSAWTTHGIPFTLAEAQSVTISLGYGTGSNNIGANNTPAIYVSHLKLVTAEEYEAIKLDAARKKKAAELEALPRGNDLFQYSNEALLDAIAALAAAKTVEEIAAVKAVQNLPDTEKLYSFQLKDGGNYMVIDNGIKLAAKAKGFSFVPDNGGGYALKDGDSYVACTGTGKDIWTMSATAEPYAWAISALGEGYYTLAKASKTSEYIGVDNTGAGSSCYANKGVSDKSTWAIAEYVAPTYTVTISNEIENGTVEATPTEAAAGETVSLTAKPAEGYELVSFKVEGVNSDIEVVVGEDHVFIMPDDDVTVSATFKEKAPAQYTVTISDEIANGTVVAEPATAEAGTTITLTITPADGYQLDRLEVLAANGNVVEVTDNTFTMPAANVRVFATFVEAGPAPIVWEAYPGWVRDNVASAYYFGVITPGTASEAFAMSGFQLAQESGAGAAERYAVIATAAPEGTTLSADKVLAVSENPVTPTVANPGKNYDYTFSEDIILKGATTYYVVFTTANEPVDGNYTVGAQRLSLNVSYGEYAPGLVAGNGTAQKNWTPGFKAQLTVPAFAITCAVAENGSIQTDVAEAKAGEKVIVTATPAEGYKLKNIMVTGKTTDIAVEVAEDGSFIMPADAVTVSATFRDLASIVYIETDLTSQFAALTNASNWKTGAGGAAAYTSTDFCPMVTPNGLSPVQVCEFYEATCNREGDLLYQTVTGLSEGTYKIELYGGAAFTFGRGFGSQAFTGETGTGDAWGTHVSDTYTAGQHIDTETGVKLYAVTSEGEFGGEIPIYYATNFPDGAAVVTLNDVKVGADGAIRIGMSKTSHSTNWHVIQLKGVTATVDAASLLAHTVKDARNIDPATVPAALATEISEVIVANDKEYETADEYKHAIAVIDAVIAKAAPYAPLTEVLKLGETYKANSSNEDAKNTYDATIAAVKAAYDAVTVEDFAAAIATVNEALPALAKSQTADNSDMSILLEGLAWTVNAGNGPNPYADCTETFAETNIPAGKVMYQSLTGLNPGKYEVKMLACANVAWRDCNTGEGIAQVYVNDVTEDIEVIAQTACTPADHEYTLIAIVGEDGTLEFGLQNIAEGGNWYVAKPTSVKLVKALDGTELAYEKALASIKDGESYRIFTEVGEKKFYLNTAGYLVADAKKAATFTFAKVNASGTLYETGINLGCKFTNPALTGGSTGDIVKDGHIKVGGNDRNDWERQVFFLKDGKYAVRATNANSENWGANTYWTVDNVEAELPNAEYALTPSYVWQIETNVDNRPEAFEKTKTWLTKLQAAEGLVTEESQWYSNAKEPSEGSYSALLDGEYTTFFHSSWSVSVEDDHYLEATLPEAVQDFYFYMKKRSQNNNNRPTDIVITASNDGENFADVTEINEGLPTGATPLDYMSDKISMDQAYSKIRFTVKATSTGTKFFTASEWYILPSNELTDAALPYLAYTDYTDLADEDVEAINTLDAQIEAAYQQAQLKEELADLAACVARAKEFVAAYPAADAEALVQDATTTLERLGNGEYTTKEEIASAKSMAITAVKLFVSAAGTPTKDTDITEWFIVNPTPTTNGDGWTITNASGAAAKANAYDPGNNDAEFWNQAAHTIAQTVTLPAGDYKLTAIALQRTDMTGYVFAGEAQTVLADVADTEVNSRSQANTWFNAGNGVNEVEFTMAETGEIGIGITTDKDNGDHWTVWRSFKIERLAPAAPESVKYAGVIEQTVMMPNGAQAGETTVTDQTVTFSEAGENKVNITFNDGFTWPVGMAISEFTIEGVDVNVNETDQSFVYSFEGTVSIPRGMIPVNYNVTLQGVQADENATPVFFFTMTQGGPVNNIYFGADADAIAAYKQAVGIKNVKGAQNVGTIYDLSGRKVEKMVKGGIYIVNGKKVSFK